MKRFFFATSALLITLCLAVVGCKKDSPEEDPTTSSSPSLISVQAEYYPLEVALYDLEGASASDGAYTGSFNGQGIDATVTKGVVAFMVPDLPEGTYDVSLSLGAAGTFSIACAVRPAPVPLAAEQYVTTVLSNMAQTSQALAVLLDSIGATPSATLLAQDHANFMAFADSVQNAIAGASETEKQEFARIMAANEHYLIELSTEVDALSSAAIQTHRDLVIDRETEWLTAAGVFVNSTAKALLRAGAVAAILSVSIPSTTVGVGVFGLVGAALLVSDIMDDVEVAKAAMVRLLDLSFLPHLQMDADLEDFQSGQDALIVVEATYRTIYQGDATAPTSNFIQRFISKLQEFRQGFSSFLASIPFSFRPDFELSELSSTFTDAVRPVHTSWLQVSSATSDLAVTVQKIANSDGSTSLRFTNTSDEERSVNYTVTYSHPDLTTLTTTLAAVVSPGQVTSTGSCNAALHDFVATTCQQVVNVFEPGQTLEDPSAVLNICVNLEHSALGDLQVYVECPNGQSLTLHGGSGGQTSLGVPIEGDEPTPIPGSCWLYCWNPTATLGPMGISTNYIGSLPNATLLPGTYAAEGPWNSLVGCPLNGTWTLTVEDNFGIDNGYLCSWSLSLAE